MAEHRCAICGTIYDRDSLAKGCEQSHSTVYVEFSRDELFMLIQFIYTKDDSLISKELMNKLLKYRRGTYV